MHDYACVSVQYMAVGFCLSLYGKNVNTGCSQTFTICLLCLESTAGEEYRTNCMQAQYTHPDKVITSPHISHSNNSSYTISF